MTSSLIASGLVVIVVLVGCLLATWVKTSASQKLKDRLLIGLVATFAAGAFFCFSLRAAFAVAGLVVACVAADFLSRKERSSDADQQH